MKNSFLHKDIIKGVVWGVVIPMLLLGCSFENDFIDMDSSESNNSGDDRVAYISVNFAAPNNNSTRSINADDYFSTRSNPTGGEWGDGREYGQDYEDSINSAVLFLYQSTSGVNAAGTTSMKYVAYDKDDIYRRNIYDKDNIDFIAKSVAKPVTLRPGTYNVLAVANPSSAFLSTVKTKGDDLTLADVRDYVETAAWVQGGTKAPYSYSSFVMASENDASTVAVDYNKEDDPANVSVDVERMAVRVDYYAPATIEITEDEENDEILDGDDAFMGSTIEITGAAIVNNLTAGSYMLKRVNDGEGTAVTYLGEETDTSGVSTNYVIDPWTEKKNGTVLSSLYGTYYPGSPATDEQKNPSYWNALVTNDNVAKITEDGTTWNRIGYTMENTTYSDYTSKQYATAVIFKALFTPTKGLVHDSFYSGYGFSYTNGSTFFKWNNNLYATPEDMMAAAYPGTFTLGSSEYGDRFDGKISSCTTWSEITTFANTLSEDDPTGYKNYLLSQASGKSGTLTTANKSALTWDYYMKEEIGYTINTSSNIVTGFTIGVTTRAALAAATNDAVSTYEDAQCYYTWWIRHSNDGDDNTNGTMEFAIVRNNIYKLNVVSAFSIGGDIPTEGIHVIVTVKAWLLYDTDIINL